MLCYLIWGMQPLYWSFLSEFSPIFILCIRVIMCVFFTYAYLILIGRFNEVISTFKNFSAMKYIAPAAVFLCADWGFFIWAVSSGHLLDSSIGYYLNPLAIFLVGVFIFKERTHVLECIAIGLACIGIVISTTLQGSFPVAAIPFAIFWPIYASIQKAAKADPIVSIAIEATLMAPFALAFIIFGCQGSEGLGSISIANSPLLLLSGLVTALPIILYTYVVNKIQFKLISIMQYVGTTLTFLCGVMLMKEKITSSKLIIFSFIWAGLVVFTVGNVRKQKVALTEE